MLTSLNHFRCNYTDSTYIVRFTYDVRVLTYAWCFEASQGEPRKPLQQPNIFHRFIRWNEILWNYRLDNLFKNVSKNNRQANEKRTSSNISGFPRNKVSPDCSVCQSLLQETTLEYCIGKNKKRIIWTLKWFIEYRMLKRTRVKSI